MAECDAQALGPLIAGHVDDQCPLLAESGHSARPDSRDIFANGIANGRAGMHAAPRLA